MQIHEMKYFSEKFQTILGRTFYEWIFLHVNKIPHNYVLTLSWNNNTKTSPQVSITPSHFYISDAIQKEYKVSII